MALITGHPSAKFCNLRIANPHPSQVEAIRYDIEGEQLTRDEIVAKCPGIKAHIVLARLHSGCRKWKFLKLPNSVTLYRVNQRRRMDSFNQQKSDIEAKKNSPLRAHVKL